VDEVLKCPSCDKYIVTTGAVKCPTCYYCGYSNEVTY
jgi:primosomal protein N'